MPSDRTIARIVVYAMVCAAAALPFVLLRGSSGSPDEGVPDGGSTLHAEREEAAQRRGDGGGRRSERTNSRSDARAAGEGGSAAAERAARADRAAAQRMRRRAGGGGDLEALRRGTSYGSEDPGADVDLEREAFDEAQRMLRSNDTAERLDGVDALAAEDPDAARVEAENVLDSATDDRWDVYDKLIDLAADDDGRIAVALRALGDADPEVRDQAAYWLSTEDGDRHPQILQSLRGALETEQHEQARDSIESALESLDLDFEPEWLSQLDAESAEPDLM